MLIGNVKVETTVDELEEIVKQLDGNEQVNDSGDNLNGLVQRVFEYCKSRELAGHLATGILIGAELYRRRSTEAVSAVMQGGGDSDAALVEALRVRDERAEALEEAVKGLLAMAEQHATDYGVKAGWANGRHHPIHRETLASARAALAGGREREGRGQCAYTVTGYCVGCKAYSAMPYNCYDCGERLQDGRCRLGQGHSDNHDVEYAPAVDPHTEGGERG